MIAIIVILILIVLVLIFIKPITEGIKEGFAEADEEIKAEENLASAKEKEEWTIFYTANLNESDFFERFSLALSQPYRKIFTNTDLTKINLSCFSLKKLNEKQLAELKSAIERDFGVHNKQTLTEVEKNYAKQADELRAQLQDDSNFAGLLDNFTFSTPYRLKFQFEAKLGVPEKEKQKIQAFDTNYQLGTFGAEGFKISVLSYLYTSAYELDLINIYELKEYMEPLINEAKELFTTWEVYGESFKIGEYSAKLTNALGRKGIQLHIKDLMNNPCTPWQNALWDE